MVRRVFKEEGAAALGSGCQRRFWELSWRWSYLLRVEQLREREVESGQKNEWFWRTGVEESSVCSLQREKLYVQQNRSRAAQTASDFKCLLRYNDVIQWHVIRFQ